MSRLFDSNPISASLFISSERSGFESSALRTDETLWHAVLHEGIQPVQQKRNSHCLCQFEPESSVSPNETLDAHDVDPHVCLTGFHRPQKQRGVMPPIRRLPQDTHSPAQLVIILRLIYAIVHQVIYQYAFFALRSGGMG
jgi:hypothetical protein